MNRPLLVLVAVFTAAATAAAAEPPGQPSMTEKDTLVCRTRTPVGTRLNARRVCLTEAQWRELRLAHKQELERFVKQSLVVKPGQHGVPR